VNLQKRHQEILARRQVHLRRRVQEAAVVGRVLHYDRAELAALDAILGAEAAPSWGAVADLVPGALTLDDIDALEARMAWEETHVLPVTVLVKSDEEKRRMRERATLLLRQPSLFKWLLALARRGLEQAA